MENTLEERGTTKTCCICKAELPLSDFHRQSRSKDGHQSRCKRCAVKLTTEWQKKWAERTNKKNAAWKRSHKGEVLSYQAAYRERNREKIRGYGRAYTRRRRAALSKEQLSALYRKDDLNRKYGITPEQYEEIFESQGRCCAICGVRKFGTRKPPVDHDHETGKVRGILCQHCNTALHKLETIRGWIEKAAAYLKRGEN